MFFNKTNKYSLAVLGATIACFLLSSTLSPAPASAYTASITTSNNISLDVSPSGDGTNIHSESINVVSDCRAGYNLTIATPSGSDLYQYVNNTASNTASFTAVDGTSALSSSNNTNKWGYTLTNNPTSSTVFSPLSSTSSTLKTPSETADPDNNINDTFNINYGIKVDNTIAPGTYQMADDGNGNAGSIVYYLTMDTTCTQYTVQFNPNGGTVTSGGNNPTQGIESGTPTKLMSADSFTAPTTASYTDAGNNTINGNADKLWVFWGWNTSIDGTGDWYKDKEEVTDLTNVGSTVTLYAQWKQATLADMVAGTPVGTEKVIDHNLMQDMKPETCYNSDITNAANAPAATLLDYRGKVTTGDNPEQPEQYTVSKLADGLCWMTTNLNLGRASGGPNNDGTITLTSDDTDLADNTTFTLPVADTTAYTATDNLAKVRLTNNSGTNANGAYYSWTAAVANTTSTSTNPTTSICPKNWDLPASNQYTNLATKSSYSSSNRTDAAPSSFLINGGFTNGGTFYQTSYSYFWGNNSYSATAAYGVRVNGTSISASSSTGTIYGGNKYYRKNIRCVASLGKVTINYEGNGTNEYPTTGSVASQTNVEISSTNAQPGTGFTRTGWVFNGWNTASDGTGTAIAANANISTLNPKPGETITLYAQWAPQYTITYVNNCQTYASANSSCTQTVSNGTSEQKINLNASGNGSGTLAAYNKWTLTGWKIAGWTTNADGTGTEYRVSSTYGVTGQNAGDSITLYAHWVPLYSIQYDGNNADNPNGMGTTTNGIKSVKQINVGEGDSIDLLASNFKRAGYGFVGWSTDSDAWAHFTDNNNSNDPVIYGPMETISAPAYPTNGTNITTLYAVWVPAKTSGGGPVYLQDFGAPDCGALTSTTFNSTTGEITANKNSIVALTDKRDNQVYTIARLADGNCWMTDNLRLDNQYTMGQNQNDSSATNQSLSQGYGSAPGLYGSFVGLANPESNNYSSTSSMSNSVYKASANPPVDTYDPLNNTLEDVGLAFNYYIGDRIPRYNNSNTSNYIDGITYTQDYVDASNPKNTPTSNYYQTQSIYTYGNYYTFSAATANTGRYNILTASEVAGSSICPSGWTLPTAYGDASYSRNYTVLAQSYGREDGATRQVMSKRLRSFPNNFIYSGYINSTSISNRGTNGYYRSRSSTGDGDARINAYEMDVSSTNLNVANPSSASQGESVRCIIDPSTIEITLDYNDGSGAASRIYGIPGESTNLPLFYRSNYKFVSWNTAANGSGADYTTSYTIPAGSSDITFYAQWTPTYTIQYDGNGASNADGMGTTDVNTGIKSVKQISIAENDHISLLPSNFKRAGYGFAGWSTDPDAWAHFTDNNNANDPIIYGPMETISAPAYPNNGTSIITMYAVWVPAQKDGNNNPIYLQEWDNLADLTDGCASLTKTNFNDTVTDEKGKIIVNKNSIIALTDKRDNEVYTIAKLADDKCWMIENLRLNNQYTMGQNQNDNTVSNQSLAQDYGGTAGTYGNFVGLASPETANFSDSTTSNSVYKSSLASPTDIYNPANNILEDIGSSNNPGYRFPRYNNNHTNSLSDSMTYTQNYINTTSPINIGANYSTALNIYSYGNYYTWAAAMANTNNFASTSDSETANTSICPTGWHLPSSSDSTKEYGILSQEYGGNGNYQSGDSAGIISNRFRSFPNNFLYSGRFLGSRINSLGIIGFYSSRSLHNSSNLYYLKLSSTSFEPSTNDSKSTGLSIRCIAGIPSYTIQYDGNSADNPNGMGTTDARGDKSVKQKGIAEDAKATLLASNFKRNGYGFIGWSTDKDAWTHFTDNDNTNDPTIYGPMESVTLDSNLTSKADTKGIIIMYAVWVPAETSGNNPVYLQDFGSQQCNGLTKTDFDPITGKITANKNSIVALTDKRDNEVYAIAKLADNNCWMIENLRLNREGTVGYNINDSTVTNESLSQGYGKYSGSGTNYGDFIGLANSELNFSNSSTAANSLYYSGTQSGTATMNINTSDSPQFRLPRYNNNNTNNIVDSPASIYTVPSSGAGVNRSGYASSNLYSYGNYYNWPAAMANTNAITDNTISESVGTSICPLGWHLPSGDDPSKELGVLSQEYGGTGGQQTGTVNAGDVMSARFRTFPNNFIYAGNVTNASIDNRDFTGYYWTRSSTNGYGGYLLLVSPTSFNPVNGGGNNRHYGDSVRCLVSNS